MKRLILIGMILTSFVIQGCGDSETKSEVTKPKITKAEVAMKNNRIKELGDPNSYSLVSASKLSTDGIKELYKHTFRARNKYNALEKQTEYVYYNSVENKVIIALSENVFTGYKKFLLYLDGSSSSDLRLLLSSNGIHLYEELDAIRNKNKDKLIELSNKYLKYNNEFYNEVMSSGKSDGLPYLSYANAIFTMYRISPKLTATALMDAN